MKRTYYVAFMCKEDAIDTATQVTEYLINRYEESIAITLFLHKNSYCIRATDSAKDCFLEEAIKNL